MNISPRLFRGSPPFAFPLAASIVLQSISAVATLLQAWWLAEALSGLFHLPMKTDVVTRAGSFFAGAALLRGGIMWISGLCSTRASHLLRSSFRMQLLHSHLHPSDFAPPRTGEFLTLLSSGIEDLDPYVRSYLPQLATAVTLPCFLLAAAAWHDALTAMILAVTAPLIPLFMVLIGKAAQSATRSQWLSLSRMGAHFLDVMRGLPTLKAMARAESQLPRVRAVADDFRRSTMRVLRIAFLSALVLELVGTLSTAIIAVQVGLRLLEGDLSLQLALFLLLLAPEFYLPLRQLGLSFHAGIAGHEAVVRLFDTLAVSPCPTPREAPPRACSKPPLLQIQGLFFSHPGRDSTLEDLSFHLSAGEHLAIIGPSGAGKSTLLALLLKLIHPSQGWMAFQGDGSLTLEAWRQSFAWVPQSPRLLNLSLAENIALGRPGASREEIVASAQAARIHDTIANLPLGYETRPGEGGVLLSSGEIQRIALARALLRKSSILLLDEPTSAIDLTTEAVLQEALASRRGRQAAIVVAHRSGIITGCDRVLRLHEKRLVEVPRACFQT